MFFKKRDRGEKSCFLTVDFTEGSGARVAHIRAAAKEFMLKAEQAAAQSIEEEEEARRPTNFVFRFASFRFCVIKFVIFH